MRGARRLLLLRRTSPGANFSGGSFPSARRVFVLRELHSVNEDSSSPSEPEKSPSSRGRRRPSRRRKPSPGATSSSGKADLLERKEQKEWQRQRIDLDPLSFGVAEQRRRQSNQRQRWQNKGVSPLENDQNDQKTLSWGDLDLHRDKFARSGRRPAFSVRSAPRSERKSDFVSVSPKNDNSDASSAANRGEMLSPHSVNKPSSSSVLSALSTDAPHDGVESAERTAIEGGQLAVAGTSWGAWGRAAEGNVLAVRKELSGAEKEDQGGDSLSASGALAAAHAAAGDPEVGLRLIRGARHFDGAAGAVGGRSLDVRSVRDRRVIVAVLRCCELLHDLPSAVALLPEIFPGIAALRQRGGGEKLPAEFEAAVLSTANLSGSNAVAAQLLALLCACGEVNLAERFIERSRFPTTDFFVPVLRFHASRGDPDSVWRVLRQMRSPDTHAEVPCDDRCGAAIVRARILRGGGGDDAIFEANKAVNELSLEGIPFGVESQNELLAAHARRGSVAEITRMLQRNYVHPADKPQRGWGAPVTQVEANEQTIVEAVRGFAIAALQSGDRESARQLAREAVGMVTQEGLGSLQVHPTASWFTLLYEALNRIEAAHPGSSNLLRDERAIAARFASAFGFSVKHLERVAKTHPQLPAQVQPQPKSEQSTPKGSAASVRRRSVPSREFRVVERRFAPQVEQLRQSPHVLVDRLAQELAEFRGEFGDTHDDRVWSLLQRKCDRLLRILGSSAHLEHAFELLDIMRTARFQAREDQYAKLLHGVAMARNPALVDPVLENMSQNRVGFSVSIVNEAVLAFTRAGDRRGAVELAETAGLPTGTITANMILHSHAECGDVDSIRELLGQMGTGGGVWGHAPPDRVSFNNLIQGYVTRRDADGASVALQELIASGIRPDWVTYRIPMKIPAEMGNIKGVQDLMRECIGTGNFTPDGWAVTWLMKAHAAAGDWLAVLRIADRLLEREKGRGTPGQAAVDPTSVEALEGAQARPTIDSMLLAIDACGALGRRELIAKYSNAALFDDSAPSRAKRVQLSTFGALALLGATDEAESRVWANMIGRPTVAWFQCLAWGYARLGDVDKVRACFQRAESQNISVNENMGAALLCAISNVPGRDADTSIFEAAKATNELTTAKIPIGTISQNQLLAARVREGNVEAAMTMFYRHYLSSPDTQPSRGLGAAPVQVLPDADTFWLLLELHAAAIPRERDLAGKYATAMVELLNVDMPLAEVEPNARILTSALRVGNQLPPSDGAEAFRDLVDSMISEGGFSKDHLTELASQTAIPINLAGLDGVRARDRSLFSSLP
jgi:pentatricopeptide repeat protein